jgi:hypothetical protein
MATLPQIQSFLVNFKSFLGKELNLVDRKKNLDDLACMGLSICVVKETLYNLTPEDYCGGPLVDKEFPHHQLWEFGVDIDGIDFYIKLSDNFNGNSAKCISFHSARQKIKFPFK